MHWKGVNCIIDLSQVCGINIEGVTNGHNSYKVYFKNGTSGSFMGEKLISQYEDFIKYIREE